MADKAKDLYDRAVELAQLRNSLSVTNLKQGLNCSDAQAKSFIRIMREEGVLGQPMANLGRFPVLANQSVGALVTVPGSAAERGLSVDLDEPERSVLKGRDIAVDEILDGHAQKQLRNIMDQLLLIEERKDEIAAETRLLMEFAKTGGLAPVILKKVARVIYKGKKRELLAGILLTELYLHTLGELVDDVADEAPAAGQVVH